MDYEALFTDLKQLDDNFFCYFQHKKKVKALENYSSVAPFSHKSFLNLVKGCLKGSFLDPQESAFLDHLLTKYHLRYLDWFHKTEWLKREMRAIQSDSKMGSQMTFPWDAQKSVTKAPLMAVHLIPKGVGKALRKAS